jgi:type III secretion protein V
VRQIGLGPEECLVNDTPERLKGLGIPANAAGNPGSGQPQSITNLEYKRGLEAQGFTTWDQMGYLILSLANVLRRNAAVFVHRGFVESQFEQLESIFPALVQAARSAVLPEQVAAVLRGLLGEEVSIRNLRLILERLCDSSLRNDPGSQLVPDGQYLAAGQTGRGNDLTQLIEFVRAGMKRETSGKYSKETNTMPAYLLEYSIEVLMSAIGSVDADTRLDSGLGKEEQDKIVESIRKEIAYLPPTAPLPVILTTRDARVVLRKAIAQDFPRLRVVAYQELMPDLNVQPVARIVCESAATKT